MKELVDIRLVNYQLEKLFNNTLKFLSQLNTTVLYELMALTFNNLLDSLSDVDVSDETINILDEMNGLNAQGELMIFNFKLNYNNNFINLLVQPVDSNGEVLKKIPSSKHIYFNIYYMKDDIDISIGQLLNNVYIEPITSTAVYINNFNSNIFNAFVLQNISRMRNMLLINESNIQRLEANIYELMLGLDNYPTHFDDILVATSIENNLYLSELVEYAPRLIATNYLTGYIPIYTTPSNWDLDRKSTVDDKFLSQKQKLKRYIEDKSSTNLQVISPIISESVEPRKTSLPIFITFIHYKCIPLLMDYLGGGNYNNEAI